MWNTIKKNLVFRFLSSVRLAVPLLVVVASAILAGTITESRYNAEYAKMVVYDTPWFIGLFFLLAINITFAALSRIPYKKIHTGFVITHVGMIVLMIGSWMTYQDGIDGSLSVQEQTSSSSVVLNERVFEMVGQSFFKKMLIKKTAHMQKREDLREINDQFIGLIEIDKYYPFVKMNEQAPQSNGPGVAFNIKNSFFDENLFLDLDQQQEINLGPATFRMIPFGGQTFKEEATKTIKPKRKPSAASSDQELVIIKDQKSQKVIRKVAVEELLKGIVLNGSKIKILQKLKNGVVVQNKIAEGDGGINPVLELEVIQGNQTFREIVYAKFPDFALSNNPGMPFKFTYLTPLMQETAPSGAHGAQSGADEKEAPADHNHGGAPALPQEGGPGNGSNIVEFQLLDSFENYQKKIANGEKVKVKVVLIKKNKIVLSKEMALQDKVETPWMGMTLTLSELKAGAAPAQAATEPEVYDHPPLFANNLPPSALVIRVKDRQDPVWLIEGQAQDITIDGEAFQIYYGRNVIQIPFKVHLDKFSKIDYAGTEMAMSFQSAVKINSENESTIISMNEPLKRDGYTLYQSSYQVQPNAPAISIFSVNKDPGRPVKYLGSLIMAIGIIIYTLMRSRYYRKS